MKREYRLLDLLTHDKILAESLRTSDLQFYPDCPTVSVCLRLIHVLLCDKIRRTVLAR
jgi:hypothetical protein